MVKSVSVTYGDKSKFQTPDQIWKMSKLRIPKKLR